MLNARLAQEHEIENIQQKINTLYKQISMMIIERIGK